jgi:hypothetical protein
MKIRLQALEQQALLKDGMFVPLTFSISVTTVPFLSRASIPCSIVHLFPVLL